LERAEYMLMLPDYLHYRLTGKMSREYTNATSTGLVNAKARTWDQEIIRALELPEKLFPATSAPGTKLGAFSKEIEEIVGYSAEVILPATHDTASAVVAAPFGGLYISSGTWSLLGAEMDEPVTGELSRKYNYTNEGHLQGVRLQKNIMGLWMIQQIRHEANDAYSFAQLADMARRCPNNYLVDVNDNRFLSPENMRAEVEAAVGRSLDTGEIAYCVFHSLAKGYAQAVNEFENITNTKYSTLNIIGGGSKNGLLNELTAKATGKHIYTGPTEATAIGNLVVQMVAAKVFDGVRSAREMVKNSFDIGEII
ncbi:MAG: rhamnulokinase, partial [Clostridiales bacterium]|nr:rhamnulokinase [Clostridiales bacterium]